MPSFEILLKESEHESFSAGHIVFQQGDLGSHLYVVKAGEVEIQCEGCPVERVGRGGILGEMALIDGESRSATAVAATDCELVPVTRERFLHLVQNFPGFSLRVLEVMARRLRRQNRS
jgi:CRP-like cAMP-binding protein